MAIGLLGFVLKSYKDDIPPNRYEKEQMISNYVQHYRKSSAKNRQNIQSPTDQERSRKLI